MVERSTKPVYIENKTLPLERAVSNIWEKKKTIKIKAQSGCILSTIYGYSI